MNRFRLIFCFFIVLFASSFSAAAAAHGSAQVSVSGIVRDGDGKPLSGAIIILSGHATYKTLSSASGEYRLSGLAMDDYALSTQLSGYGPSVSLKVSLSSASPSAVVDFKLIRVAPILRASDKEAAPPLQFESSSVRGLIDPGGYSASTGSAAATGVLRGMADIKRDGDPTDTSADNSPTQDWPCSLEPALSKALAEHPGQFDPNYRMGQFYLSHDQPGEAIPFLKSAMTIDATNFPAARDLALAWLSTQDFRDARALMTSLGEMHDRPELHQLLARADEGSGLFPQAAAEYRKADAEHPDQENIFSVGYELLLSGSVAESGTVFEAALERYPRSVPLWLGAGTAQFLSGKTAAAIERYLSATEIDPKDTRPYPLLSAASGASHAESARVLEVFQRLLNREPDNAQANYFYALALSRADDPANSARIEQLLKRAVQLDPGLADAHVRLADAYLHRDDPTDAAFEYQAALLLSDDRQTHYRLALALKRAGRSEESMQQMRKFRGPAGAASDSSPASDSEAHDPTGEGKTDLAQFVSVMSARDPRSRQSAAADGKGLRTEGAQHPCTDP